MSWGWIGALAGAGAAVLFAPFTGGASLAAVPKFLLLAGAGAAMGAGAGKITSSILGNFGDTPKNNAQQVGINPEKLHEEAKTYKKKHKKYLEEKNKGDQKEIDDLDKKLESLDDGIKSLQKEVTKMDDNNPTKATKVAQLNAMQNQRDETKEKRDNIQKKIDDRNEKIDDIFKSLGDPVNYTQSKFNEKANSPNWSSYKNWGIIAACVLIFFLLFNFLRKFLGNMLKSTSN
jgi:hypothetical protein